MEPYYPGKYVCKSFHVGCWRHFLFLACTNIWVPGNEFSMPRLVYAFARADRVSVLHSKRKHVRSYSLYSKHLTRTQFCTRSKNITHIVIPLSLCKYTLFSKSEDHLFCQPVHLRSTRTIVTWRILYIFQAEKATAWAFKNLSSIVLLEWFSIFLAGLLQFCFALCFEPHNFLRKESHNGISMQGII